MLENIVGGLWNKNLFYRLLGTRRYVTDNIKKHMESMYDNLETYNIRDAILYGYLETFKNNINVLKDNYWNVTIYEIMLLEYYEKNKEWGRVIDGNFRRYNSE